MKPEKPYNWDQEGDFVLDPAYVICVSKEQPDKTEHVVVKFFERRDTAIVWAERQSEELHSYWTYKVI